LPKVIVPPPYQGPTQGVGELLVDGTSVLECLEGVELKYPGFLALVLDGSGRLHRFVKLFKNGDQIDAGAFDLELDPEDELEILAAIAGG